MAENVADPLCDLKLFLLKMMHLELNLQKILQNVMSMN